MNTEKIDKLFDIAIDKRYFPSAIAVIGDACNVYYKKVYGWSRVFSDDAPCYEAVPAVIPETAVPADINTLYDMASLTKLIAASMIAFRFIEDGKLTMYDTLDMFFGDVPAEKRKITIFNLMTHTGGISAHFHLDSITTDYTKTTEVILNQPLTRPVGSDVEYSCMGYILLGKILEIAGGATLDILAEKYVFEPLKMKRTCYNPLNRSETNIAVTEFDARTDKYICGIVHDKNARFQKGISANAGVFSCADDLIKFATMLSRHGDTYLSSSLFREAIFNHTQGMADNRGWGFQLKSSGLSSMGDIYSNGSFGHTGFTGTSIFVDSVTGLYTILLTNRIHYTRNNSELFRFRRILHNSALSMIY